MLLIFYFTHISNPKDPWRGTFLNLQQREWDNYDIEWPEFNKRSQAFLNIGNAFTYSFRFLFAL